MVFIPEVDRGTLCISSQVGCALDCAFCSTAQQGFNRNLTTAEIVGQVWLANKELGFEPGGERRITNVVFMGMGEPLANFRNVVPAIRILLDDLGFDISRRRVTLSTSGLVPLMYKLAEEVNCALAVSLHAPDDALRPPRADQPQVPDPRADGGVQPVPRPRPARLHHDGVRDARRRERQRRACARAARACARHGVRCKFNLIPFNPFPASGLTCSGQAVVQAFAKLLLDGGIVTTVRKTRGDDIDAACGQLAGDVHDRTRVGERIAQQRAQGVIPIQPLVS